MQRYLTLGIDLGSESIGWALVAWIDGKPKILGAGAVIFNNGRDKDGKSLAVGRRLKRGMRRRRARYLWRRDRLLRALIRFGLMPMNVLERKALEVEDSYRLRAQSAEKAMQPYELGRALFHLNQRRGFASNRKANKKDKESGAYKEGIQHLKEILGDRTLGQYLWQCHQDPKNKADIAKKTGVRFRSIQDGEKIQYPFYPTREMYKMEYDKIHQTQKQHQPLTDAQWTELRDIMFFQRPLKPVDVGICSLYYGQEITNLETGEIVQTTKEKRGPYALPSAQMFRIAQEINNLKVRDDQRQWRKLTPQERENLWALMHAKKEVTFSAIRKGLGWAEDAIINLENDRRKNLNGNKSTCVLAKYFGKVFYKKPLELQDAIVEGILDCEDEDELFREAVSSWGLTEDAAQKMVYEDEIGEDDFPAGYGRLSAKAFRALVPLMKDEGLRYDEATARLGIHHSDRRADGTADHLPYYAAVLPLSVTKPKYGNEEEKREGKIANPTVHIALRQLQKLVNTLIARYGKPDQIVIETARELKLSKVDKDRLKKEHKANKEENDEFRKTLESCGEWKGDKKRLLLKMKLWKELGKDPNDRRCPYTLQIISQDMLLRGPVEIEHILPSSRTLDDSIANLTIAVVSANRMKRNQSPHEAFAHEKPLGWNENEGEYSYDKILQRAKAFPKNKSWRFEADAMERYADENRWQSRFLNDTRYASKIAKQYLETICPKVNTSTGQLTAKIREQWGLNTILGHNKKNRDDHRQHAVDALILTQITPSLIQQAARANANESLDAFVIPSPQEIGWPTLWEDARKAILGIIVHHRPDHGTDGALSEDSAYGILYHEEAKIDRRTSAEKKAGEEEKNIYNLVIRKDVTSLRPNELGLIRDVALRRRVIEAAALDNDMPTDKKAFEKKLKERLTAFMKASGIRRVRLLKKDNPVKIIRHGHQQQHAKALVPGDIHHVAVWRMPDGDTKVVGTSVFDAKTKEGDLNAFKPHPAAKLLMKLHKRDVVRLVHKGEEKTAKIVSLKPSNDQLVLVEHFEAGDLEKRQKEEKIQIFISFSKILEQQLRKIYVDPAGRVYDRGPHPVPEKKRSRGKKKPT